jgi:hypothetical protein
VGRWTLVIYYSGACRLPYVWGAVGCGHAWRTADDLRQCSGEEGRPAVAGGAS